MRITPLTGPIHVSGNDTEDQPVQTPPTEYPGPPQQEPTDPTPQ